jgi:hypothetical protein
METSLHRQLKALYARGAAHTEVKLGPYRIDVMSADRLIEVQHGSLAAIRHKITALLAAHRVLVVKPIIATKRIIYRGRRGGKIIRQRLSPKRGTLIDAFHELVYFTRVFPRDGLQLEIVLVDIEEDRYPGHGRRRRWRRNDYQIEDQRLVEVRESCTLRTSSDLRNLLPTEPQGAFHTAQLAESLGVDRWVAQRVAYCLRQCAATRVVGKTGNAWVYEWQETARPRRVRRRAA